MEPAGPSTTAVAPLQHIRKMTAVDRAAVSVILSESPEAAQWDPWNLQLVLPGEVQVWVADYNGEVIGGAAARAATGEAELLNLAVRPGQRGKGWGHALVLACVEE